MHLIYVDDARIPATVRGIFSEWSHLISVPGNIGKLVEFGFKIGLKKEWLQHPTNPSKAHFDVTTSKRNKAIKKGAIAITMRELQTLIWNERKAAK